MHLLLLFPGLSKHCLKFVLHNFSFEDHCLSCKACSLKISYSNMESENNMYAELLLKPIGECVKVSKTNSNQKRSYLQL